MQRLKGMVRDVLGDKATSGTSEGLRPIGWPGLCAYFTALRYFAGDGALFRKREEGSDAARSDRKCSQQRGYAGANSGSLSRSWSSLTRYSVQSSSRGFRRVTSMSAPQRSQKAAWPTQGLLPR